MSRAAKYAAATGIALVVAGAVITGLVLRDRGGADVATSAPPSASPTLATLTPASPTAPATGTASAAAATATAAPTLGQPPLDARFGFVVGNREMTVRSETSDTVIASFAPKERSFVFHARSVSPDGRLVAYWDPVDGAATLRVRPVTGGDARAVLTGRPEMSGGAFAWSSDSAGIVAALDNNCFEMCAGTPVAELWTVDLTSGATEMIASGKIWIPVAWDRIARLVAAGVTGPGGYLTAYDVLDLRQRPHAVRSSQFQPPSRGSLKASGDARFVFLSVALEGQPGSLEWWPIAEPEKRSAVAFDGQSAEWRPGTTEIWWMGGLEPANCRMELCAGTQLTSFNVLTRARTVAYRGRFGSLLESFRVDGSAAIISAHGSARTELMVIEIATGSTATVSIDGYLEGAALLR